MRIRIGAAMVVAGLWATGAAAQDKIEWKQVLNVATGANLPPGVKGDILGIELGASYSSIKERVKQLEAEAIPPPVTSQTDKTTANLLGQEDTPPVRETRGGFRLPTQSGTNIEADYATGILLSRRLPGSGKTPISEFLEIQFSAPPSGHQVIAVERRITYADLSDQVRIADVVASISEKFKSQPQEFQGQIYRWQFNDGRPFVSSDSYLSCVGLAQVPDGEVERMNKKGECDVMLDVSFSAGVSKAHASGISFRLVDFERAKANQMADYEFFHGYVQSLVDRTSGAAPKL